MIRTCVLNVKLYINILTSVRVEPTKEACAPRTATSDALKHYTIEASPIKDAQNIYMDYVSTVVIKTSVVLQTEKNIIIHCRK